MHYSKKAASEGRQWRQPLTQATTGRNRAAGRRDGVAVAGDPIKISDKHRSTARQKKNMNKDDIISQGVRFRGCFADCYMTIIRMFTTMLVSIIKNLLLIYPPDSTRPF